MSSIKSFKDVKTAILNYEKVNLNGWTSYINNEEEIEIWNPKGEGVVSKLSFIDRVVIDFIKNAQEESMITPESGASYQYLIYARNTLEELSYVQHGSFLWEFCNLIDQQESIPVSLFSEAWRELEDIVNSLYNIPEVRNYADAHSALLKFETASEHM